MDEIEEVKKRINIVDFIGTYVQLKKAGRNFRGSAGPEPGLLLARGDGLAMERRGRPVEGREWSAGQSNLGHGAIDV